MTKAPTLTGKSKKQRDIIKNATKTSITRLRTDLGHSVDVTAGTLTGVVKRVYERSTFPLPQQPCKQKDTHLKMSKNPPY